MAATRGLRTIPQVMTVWFALPGHPRIANAQEDGLGVFQLDLQQERSLLELLETADNFLGSNVIWDEALLPYSWTRIDRDAIWRSSARSLDELLNIHTPNLQIINHHFESDHLGVRGLIGDRDDKYLLLVDQRVMNHRSHRGAYMERDLVLLGDINRVEIARGPGSVIYGPGAMAAVVNLIPESSKTFTGFAIGGEGGAIEEYASTELKFGRRWEPDVGVFIYAGAASYSGAAPEDAPLLYGRDLYDREGNVVVDGGKASPYANWDYRNAREKISAKIHAQLDWGRHSIWSRFTRGGKQYEAQGTAVSNILSFDIDPDLAEPPHTRYHQWTNATDSRFELGGRVRLRLRFSHQSTEFLRMAPSIPVYGGPQAYPTDVHREDEFQSQVFVTVKPSLDHIFTLALEASRAWYGNSATGLHGSDPRIRLLPDGWKPWSYGRGAVFGEYAWTINHWLRLNTAARVDQHEAVSTLFSPRMALVLTPTLEHAFKLHLNRSQRTNFAAEIRRAELEGEDADDVESLITAEAIYQYLGRGGLTANAAVFVQEMRVLGFSDVKTTEIADQRIGGFDLELKWEGEALSLTANHGFATLFAWDQLDPDAVQHVTVNEEDLNYWSDHTSKFVAGWRLHENWRVDASLQINWKYSGFQETLLPPPSEEGLPHLYSSSAAASSEDEELRVDEPSVYGNLGIGFERGRFRARLGGHNLLGMLDEDLNKRIIHTGGGAYRDLASAASLKGEWSF